MVGMTNQERVARMRHDMSTGVIPGCWNPLGLAEWVVKEQDRREGPLVAALRKISAGGNLQQAVLADAALAAYDALDAKPEPTLLEAAKRVCTEASFDVCKFDFGTHVTLNGWPTAVEDMRALKAAIEREESRAGKDKP